VGVRFSRVRDCSLTGNTFTGNVEAAVLLIGRPGVSLDDNRFEGNAADIERQ
jgi:hypothetical protein